MSSFWENYLLLRIGNSIFIIIAVVIFIAIIVKLFKNTFINHCSSENIWKNIALYLCGIAVVSLSGIGLISAIGNGYTIAEIEAVGETLVNGVPYKEILLHQIQSSFRRIIRDLVLSGIFYFLYIRVVGAITLEIEELRKKVVHWNLKK